MADLVNAPQEGDAKEVERPEDSIPEQFQGKSFQNMVEMYQNLEKKLGQQSEELGSLRALAETSVAPKTEEEKVDFYDNPEGAIERIIERKLAPFNAQIRQQQEAEVRTRLNAEYPGWEDTVKSEDFQSWVVDSKVRTDLFVQANAASYDAAKELLETWQARTGSAEKTQKAEEKAVRRDRKLRAAATEKGSSGVDSKKILNRSDLRALKQNNPTKYNELLPDIRRAYAEGRVR